MYKLNKYVKQLASTNYKLTDFVWIGTDTRKVKTAFLEELKNSINYSVLQDDFNYLSVNIQKLSSKWKVSISLPQNFCTEIKFDKMFTFQINFSQQSPQLLKILINQNLIDYVRLGYRLTISIYVKTDTYYLQFTKTYPTDFNNSILNGERFAETSGYVYTSALTNPSLSDLYIEVKNNSNEIILFEPLSSQKYLCSWGYTLSMYRVTDIPYFADKKYLTFTKGSSTYNYEIEIPIITPNENLQIEIEQPYTDKLYKEFYKLFLPQSYLNFPFLRIYTYDLALALLVLVNEYLITEEEEYKNLAINIFNTAKQLRNSRNSFNFLYPINGVYSDGYIRNGAVAWMLEALAYAYRFIADLRTSSNLSFITSVANYLASEIQSNGLVRGGYGRYVEDVFDASYIVPWFSTEHNVDSYFALRSVYKITNNSQYQTYAERIKNSLINNIYNGERLTQGYLDNAGALDIHTWGTIFLYKIGFDMNKVYKNYQFLDTYYRKPSSQDYFPDFYSPYSSEQGYPNASNVLWFEGAFQAIYTKALVFGLFKEAEEYLDKTRHYLFMNRMPYSIGADNIYEIGEYPSLASMAWFIFAYNLIVLGRESFWLD